MKKTAEKTFVVSLAALTLGLTACQGSSGGSASRAPVLSDGGSGDGGGDGTGAGGSCAGDANTLCLAVKFVSYQDSSGVAAASRGQADTIMKTMNSLFSQCGVGFTMESYAAVDPTDYGLSYGAASQNETNSIRSTFSTSNQLLSVTTGPWGTSVNAWTNMPGEGVYGAIMESSIVGYGAGIIYAHEFGHYLGLDHAGSSSQLMNPVIYTSSKSLTDGECETVRDTAAGYWARMLR